METQGQKADAESALKERRVFLGMALVGAGFLIPYILIMLLSWVQAEWTSMAIDISHVVGALLLLAGFTVAALQMNHLTMKLALIGIPLVYLILSIV